jgi:hypothetical protein
MPTLVSGGFGGVRGGGGGEENSMYSIVGIK